METMVRPAIMDEAQEDTELVPVTDPRAAIVSIDPRRLHGTPCFAGTRVPLYNLWDYLSDGGTMDTFLECFPTVSRAQAVNVVYKAGELLLEGLPKA